MQQVWCLIQVVNCTSCSVSWLHLIFSCPLITYLSRFTLSLQLWSVEEDFSLSSVGPMFTIPLTSYQSSITAAWVGEMITGVVAGQADEVISYAVFNATLTSDNVTFEMQYAHRKDVGELPQMSIMTINDTTFV